VTDYSEVTELAGSPISAEQLARLSHRYGWAAQYCAGRDVVEVACGCGAGLGLLGAVSRSLEGGDYSPPILDLARTHYRERVRLIHLDAQSLPYEDATKDVIILFEAIYYLPDAARFVAECRRVLRPGGQVLVATANRDLWDFNPSPLSHRYYGAGELASLFHSEGFDVQLFGYMPVGRVSWRQKALRPLKLLAVRLGIMPKTLKGKRLLKRLVFGRLVLMPAELEPPNEGLEPPVLLPGDRADGIHKVLYCRATLPG
jgi:SAM-dependent methyltransferase